MTGRPYGTFDLGENSDSESDFEEDGPGQIDPRHSAPDPTSDGSEGELAHAATRAADPKSWKEDSAEYSRRIWMWWVARLKGQSFFSAWALAIRLVVLVQSSSAAAERAFSQLRLILQVVGNKVLEDMLEFRMHCRCNK